MIYCHKRLLTKIAHMYYDENNTQQEISEKLGMSRPSISRMLHRARQEGIVDIKVHYEGSFTKWEDALEKKFNLKEVIIVPWEEGEGLKQRLAEAAADFLDRSLKSQDIVGVSWGTTLVHIPKYVNKVVKDLTFVPLVGGVGQTKLDIHSNAITMNLARTFGAKGHLLHAPVIVDSVEVKTTLMSDTNIRHVLDLASRADVALIGIGSPLAPNSTIRQTGYYSEKELKDLTDARAACDICWIFMDAEGKLCPLKLNQRVIGISIEALKDIPTVVGIAGGSEKHGAVLATLKGHYIDVLVTDEQTANFLLKSIGG